MAKNPNIYKFEIIERIITATGIAKKINKIFILNTPFLVFIYDILLIS